MVSMLAQVLGDGVDQADAGKITIMQTNTPNSTANSRARVSTPPRLSTRIKADRLQRSQIDGKQALQAQQRNCQLPGDMMVTWPGTAHSGVNLG